MKKLFFIFLISSLFSQSQIRRNIIPSWTLDTLPERDIIKVNFNSKWRLEPRIYTPEYFNAKINFNLYNFKLVIPKNFFYYREKRKIYKIFY